MAPTEADLLGPSKLVDDDPRFAGWLCTCLADSNELDRPSVLTSAELLPLLPFLLRIELWLASMPNLAALVPEPLMWYPCPYFMSSSMNDDPSLGLGTDSSLDNRRLSHTNRNPNKTIKTISPNEMASEIRMMCGSAK